MIKVRVLQVNTDPQNIEELSAAVAAGHTEEAGWQMPRDSVPGDLVVWYAAGRQRHVACGFVDSSPVKVDQGFGPYCGQVAAVQRIEEVDRKKVLHECGVDGGRQGYQTVKDEIAADFLRSVGLLA